MNTRIEDRGWRMEESAEWGVRSFKIEDRRRHSRNLESNLPDTTLDRNGRSNAPRSGDAQVAGTTVETAMMCGCSEGGHMVASPN